MTETLAQPHHLIEMIASILLFFAISGIIVPLLQRLKLSPVLGYLLCGIAIGPYGFGQLSGSMPWLSYLAIDDAATVHTLGELGIIALMFMIGLELSLKRLKELKRLILGLGSAQILVTALVIMGIASLFENSLESAILLGACFALSSTAIVMKLLEEQKLASRPIGILCFSVLLMQDLAVVPILVLAASLGGDAETSIAAALGTSLLVGAATVIGIYWLGKRVLTPLLQSISFSSTPEWLAAFIVFLVLACSALTYSAGLSLALGAFLAGLLIAETEFRHEVEVIINPIKGILLGIFFLSVGMMVNLAEVARHPLLLLVAVVGIYLVKAIIIFALCLAFRLGGKQAGAASIYLAQPGEFALMILGVALTSQLMPFEDVQFFLLVTVLAMMLTPFLFKLAPVAAALGQRLNERECDPAVLPLDGAYKVVIAGFGRVGQLIATILEDQQTPYIAFDTDGERVQRLRKQNFHVIYGDARKKALWQQLVGEHIEAAVIAIDDQPATAHVIASLRTEFPLLPVIVRAKEHGEVPQLYDNGASEVVEETLESSLRIAQLVMQALGSEPDESHRRIEQICAKITS